jgi:hypothetical protein
MREESMFWGAYLGELFTLVIRNWRPSKDFLARKKQAVDLCNMPCLYLEQYVCITLFEHGMLQIYMFIRGMDVAIWYDDKIRFVLIVQLVKLLCLLWSKALKWK